MPVNLPSTPTLLASAVALRLALIVWGLWQDAHLEVPYTDVDYQVFSDAAEAVHRGAHSWQCSTVSVTCNP